MSEEEILKALISFFCGIALGFLNFRLFERSLESLIAQGENKSLRKQAVRAGFFRHVFIFLAGISLIRVASLPPIHLCGGLFVAVVIYRVRLWSRSTRGKREGDE